MKKKIKKVNAAILIIGNEILSGRTQDKNIAFISNWLNSKCGITVKEVRIIPDEEKTIIEDSWEEYKTIVGGKENIYNLQDIYKDINKNVSIEIIFTKLKHIFNNAILTSVSNGSFKHIGIYNTSIAVMRMINHLEISYNQFEDSSLFQQIMNKYDVWSASDNNSVLFPTAL